MPAPLSLKALRGKVVLLDFWTYGCINCIHILPDLQKLEERFPDELVVIGVHAAKFTNEKATENIRQIILPLRDRAPRRQRRRVPHLARLRASARGPRASSSIPQAISSARLGRRQLRGLRQAIANSSMPSVRRSAARSTARPLALKLEREGAAETPLMFPGKVLATGRIGCSSAD